MWRTFTFVAFIFCTTTLFLQAGVGSEENINAIILKEVSGMPRGGGYSTRSASLRAFASSIKASPAEGLIINSSVAKPSFCSAATYTIFLKTLVKLQKNSVISLSPQVWDTLLVRNQPDGVGIWGRWNANGPGTGCLFHELSLGPNFTSFSDAKPGDFAKFFWNSEVGEFEHGHSVIYLGSENRNGTVRFWSSNIPGGYGEKSVPRTRIARAIFSRLTTPQNIGNHLAPKNNYLASLLTKRSTFQEALQHCGITTK